MSTAPDSEIDADGSRGLHGLGGCLLVDGPTITAWQHAALSRAIDRGFRISLVLECRNTHLRRNLRKYGAYYAFATLTSRSDRRRRVPWHDLVGSDVPRHPFRSTYEGMWQRVPPDAAQLLTATGVDVVIKFGMGLLRGADDLGVPGGVLSYHHGDPAEYRGRPAGFYELLDDTDRVGAMVQQISDELDAGRIVAIGHSKIVSHSFSQTLDRLYGNSTYLLTSALGNVRDGRTIDWPTGGRNCRLPDTPTVLRLCGSLARRRATRLLYGATKEKAWRVARGSVDLGDQGTGSKLLRATTTFEPPRGHRFVADPMPVPGGGFLCEALDNATGLGRMYLHRERQWSPVDTSALGNGHLSYPFVVEAEGQVRVAPEMAQIGPQTISTLDGDRLTNPVELEGLQDERLTDPTLFRHEGRWWLFAGRPGSAADLLFLWSSGRMTGPYVEHPANPIVMDPGRARMAGPLTMIDGRLHRVGQDNRRGYGDGVAVCMVTRLDEEAYEERLVANVGVAGASGPHTLALDHGDALFDLYTDRRSLGAGVRRVSSRLRALRST